MESIRFVGMDVHKDAIQLAVLSESSSRSGDRVRALRGQRPGRDEEGDEADTPRKSHRGRVRSRMYGLPPATGCSQIGVQCAVIAPSSIARAPGDRVKTDRGDAAAIARLLRNGEGERVHVPTTGDEAVRDYLRRREDVRQELQRYRQRLQQALIQLVDGAIVTRERRRLVLICRGLDGMETGRVYDLNEANHRRGGSGCLLVDGARKLRGSAGKTVQSPPPESPETQVPTETPPDPPDLGLRACRTRLPESSGIGTRAMTTPRTMRFTGSTFCILTFNRR